VLGILDRATGDVQERSGPRIPVILATETLSGDDDL
jgi:hypothetical protein